MVRFADLKPLAQVRIYAMRFVCDAQIRLRRDLFYPHLTHMPLHLFAIDHMAFTLEAGRQATRAVERTPGIEFVNAVLQSDLLDRGRNRLVIEARAIES